MALTILDYATDQSHRYGAIPTIALRDSEAEHMLTLAVTLEKDTDEPILQQIIDAFIAKHTPLLPDYQAIEFPRHRILSIMVYIGQHVSITYLDVDDAQKSFNYQYTDPSKKHACPPTDLQNH